MDMHLRIAVYRGGKLWQECWDSVKKNLDLFEGVYISFNYSETQDADIALIRNETSEKIHWIKQEKTLSAEKHGILIDRWLADFHLNGHIFILCHDDILSREGLLELKEKNLKADEAVIGGYCFFSDDDKSNREIIAHEFCNDSNIPITTEQFISQFEYKMLNVSGIVLPTSIFAHKNLPWQMLWYGCWAELCYLANPYIKNIYQMMSPTVKVRWHQSSETSHTPKNAFLYDSLVLYCHVFSAFANHALRMKMVANIGYLIKKNVWRGFLYFIQIQFSLLRLNYYYPAALKIYWYAILKIFRRNGL